MVNKFKKIKKKDGEFSCFGDVLIKNQKICVNSRRTWLVKSSRSVNFFLWIQQKVQLGRDRFLLLEDWKRTFNQSCHIQGLAIWHVLNIHKKRTDKLCLTAVAIQFVACDDNRKRTFNESYLKISELIIGYCLVKSKEGLVLGLA